MFHLYILSGVNHLIVTNILHLYQAFGLLIHSEFTLPELFLANGTESLATVTVKKADLTNIWQELSQPDEYFVILDRKVLFMIPEVGIFCVEDGHTLLVSPFTKVEEDRLRLYILGTGMGLILLQKRILPLHGSCIAINGKAYAILGHSGAGKSTLASVLLNQGYRLLSDDIIPIVISEQIPIAIPSYPQQKLWQESMQALDISQSDSRPIYNRETKFAVPAHAYFHADPLPLGGVFELVNRANESDAFIQPIHGMERYLTLFHHTYRNFYINRGGLMDWHFNILAAFVNRISVNRLGRPSTGFSANELASYLLNAIHKEGNTHGNNDHPI
jgi:hypothetical protein